MGQRGEAEAWSAAAADLGIEVSVRGDAVVVKDFGGQNGMLCAIRSSPNGASDLRELAEHQGMGWSVLSSSYAEYDRELFIDTLKDWGWTGDGEPPHWYSAEPWSN